MRTVFTNGRIGGATTLSTIVVDDGTIIGIEEGGALEPEAVDLGRQLVLPGFVDGHAHADKSMWGEPWVRRTSVDITMDQMFEDTLQQWSTPQSPVVDRARRFLERCVAAGSTTIRAFADVAPEIGLEGVHAMLALREEFAGLADIQIVAFPQLGLLRKPGTADLLDQALAEGADWVGGLDPAAIDHDALAALDTVFALADKHQAGVDFHAHESGDLGVWLIERIAERTTALGMQGRVGLCDVFSLAEPDSEQFSRLAAALSDADIAVAVGVHGLLPVPDVRGLHERGVAMCLGSDSSRSLWSPWGDGDILSRATFLSYKKYWRTDDDLEFAAEIATSLGRRAIGLEPVGVEVGAPADFVVLPGETVAEVVVQPPQRSLVVKAGAIVARDGELVRS